MKKIKTRIGILFILLTVFTMFASCLNDDDEPKDKQKTVTLYVSATTGERDRKSTRLNSSHRV